MQGEVRHAVGCPKGPVKRFLLLPFLLTFDAFTIKHTHTDTHGCKLKDSTMQYMMSVCMAASVEKLRRAHHLVKE